MSWTDGERFRGLGPKPLFEDVLRAALPKVEDEGVTLRRPGARVTPPLIAGEPLRCVQQAALALIETLSAKLRVFRAPEFLATAFLFAVLGLLVHLLLGG